MKKATKRRKLTGRYQEGAKGHCYWCGRPEGEHKGGECPGFKEKNEVAGRQGRRQRDHRGVGGFGIVR